MLLSLTLFHRLGSTLCREKPALESLIAGPVQVAKTVTESEAPGAIEVAPARGWRGWSGPGQATS
jgi:hypothetical protein